MPIKTRPKTAAVPIRARKRARDANAMFFLSSKRAAQASNPPVATTLDLLRRKRVFVSFAGSNRSLLLEGLRRACKVSPRHLSHERLARLEPQASPVGG